MGNEEQGRSWSGAGCAAGRPAGAAAPTPTPMPMPSMPPASPAAGGGREAKTSGLSAALATPLGKAAGAAAAFVLLAGAGLAAYSLLKGGGGESASASPNLGPIASSVKVRAGGADRMSVAGRGELRFDQPSRSSPPPAEKRVEEAPADEQAAAPAPQEAAAAGPGAGNKPSGRFGEADIFGGSNDIFANKGGGAAPKFDSGKSKVDFKKTRGKR